MKIELIISILLSLTLSNLVKAQKNIVWESKELFKYPESAAYDGQNDEIYISNYSGVADGINYGNHYISKIDKTGKILDLNFIGNLTAPTGLLVANQKLFIVERFGVVVFDLKTETVCNKYLIQNTKFINDISIATDSSLYITDSQSNVIYRIKNHKVEKWLECDSILYSNGILVDTDKIIVGVNSDNYLKSIDIKSKKISKIAYMGKGEIDGIKRIKNGYLVSHYEGTLFFVAKNGEITELLNTRDKKIQCADFEYIQNDSLLIIPALINNKVFGYKLNQGF